MVEEVEQDVCIGQKFDCNAVINNMLFDNGGPTFRLDIP